MYVLYIYLGVLTTRLFLKYCKFVLITKKQSGALQTINYSGTKFRINHNVVTAVFVTPTAGIQSSAANNRLFLKDPVQLFVGRARNQSFSYYVFGNLIANRFS